MSVKRNLLESATQPSGRLLLHPMVRWDIGDNRIELSGSFSASELLDFVGHMTKHEMDGWSPVDLSTPKSKWMRTKKLGEDGENVCMLVDGGEWVERHTGVTTVTHHSFSAPTHWRHLELAAPPK